MSQERQEGENLAPQVRSEVTTGAARLGAALLNTSTDPLTQIPERGSGAEVGRRRDIGTRAPAAAPTEGGTGRA